VQARLGWFGVAVLFSILALAAMLPICFTARERNIVRAESGITFKQMVTYIAKNKFILIFYVSMTLNGIAMLGSYVTLFFARYNLGNQELASVLVLITMVPMIVVGAFVPLIIKKIEKYYLYLGLSIFSVGLSFIRYFVGYENFTLFVVLNTISSIVGSANAILVFLFTPDCMEYGTYHTGERAEGVASAVQSFFNKLTGGLSGSLAMLIIGAFGFLAGENVEQSASAIKGIWLTMTVFPGIFTAVAVAALLFYKLRDKDVQIMAKYNAREITKEEAERSLAAKYGVAAELNKMIVTHD
jgi:probable glucitol transport protein GutA